VQRDSTAYWLRRLLARLYRRLLKWFGIFAVLALVPYLSKAADVDGGIAALLVGIGGGVWKLYQSGKAWISLEVLAPIAAGLVLFGMFVTAYSIGWNLDFEPETVLADWRFTVLALVGAAAILLGYVVNLNHIGIGRYYRDRLMEAFMPNLVSIEANQNAKGYSASTADDFGIGKLAAECRTPYHLVNAHAVLMDSSDELVRKRGGDSFVFSPLYIGSASTGWLSSARYWGGDMSLATAMAISAAAINPHAGVSGRGLTRNRSVALLMALLNVRLGYWAPNPARPSVSTYMHHFWAGWYELAPNAGYNERSTFVQLSDGGHFDNTGLYELFRRKARFILVLDGGADPDFQFEDLQNALYRAQRDFNVAITFHEKPNVPATEVSHFDDLIPQEQEGADIEKFPGGLKLAERGYAKGRIYYDEQTPSGWIFLIKTTLIKGMSMRVKGYKGAHPDFPDQATVDQFFDEDQFDAYRILGDEIAKTLIQDQERDFGGRLRAAYLST
jgi:hypothetical protein